MTWSVSAMPRGGREPMAIVRPAFVGRERELAALEQALAAPPAVVLIEGEAGIGKSRLLREYLSSQAGARAGALVGGCLPLRHPHTLAPVVDALRQATGQVAGLRLSPLAGALRPLLPEWLAQLPPLPDPLEDATAVRHRLFRALAELLNCLDLASLVIEDLHWADEATLEFLAFVMSLPDQPVNVVVTYRREDLPPDSLLLRVSSRLPAGRRQLRLTLRSLDVGQTAELMSSMLDGEHVSEQFAGLVHQRTDGIPLAVEESVRLLGDHGDLVRRDGTWVRHKLARIVVPSTVREAVLERAARLSGDALLVLQAAAVLSEPAGESTVGLVSGLAAPEQRAGLVEALRRGLLEE